MLKKSSISFLGLLLTVTVSNLSAQDNINFSAELLSGKKIEFAQVYSKGVTLVNFWALWCKPCRVEMKALKELHEKYKDNGFQILGINQDSPRSVSKVESFVKSQDIKYDVVLDTNKELFEIFNGQVVPLTILYNKEGKVVYQNSGYLPGDEFKLEEEIKKALAIN
jgi:thiol-disulfide isomerase/thioredoxin